jgi:hypothetical protein
MNLKRTKSLSLIGTSFNSDYIGALGSILCLIHCFATPFLFAAQATAASTCSDISPTWWKMIDLVFMVITYLAVNHSSKMTILIWMPIALYFFWLSFAVLVLNNFSQFLHIPHALIYIPAIFLSGLHLYNRKYCGCNSNI